MIIGDANLSETSTYLKLGTTSLVLDPDRGGPRYGFDLTDLALARPVHAVHVLSRDPSLRATVALADGRELTGLALQRIYLDRVAGAAGQARSRCARGGCRRDVGERAGSAGARPDGVRGNPGLARQLRLLEGFRRRENLSWSAPRLHLVDLQYSDVRLDKGLYNRLVARGSMKRLVTEQQVLDAIDNPRPIPAPISGVSVCAASAPISRRRVGIR